MHSRRTAAPAEVVSTVGCGKRVARHLRTAASQKRRCAKTLLYIMAERRISGAFASVSTRAT